MAAVDTRGRSSGPEADTPDYGILLRYADFGRLIQIEEPQMTTNGFVLGIVCEADRYYILLRQPGLSSLAQPVDMLLAAGAPPPGEPCTLVDRNPPMDSGNGIYYSVISIPVDSPRDADGDRIDDVYELQHASILNPLAGTDVLEDADGALDLIVVNENARSLTVLAGNGDGTFQSRPAVTFSSTPKDAVLAKFGGDTNSDLAVALTSSQVLALRQILPASLGASSLTLADLDGDHQPDLLVTDGGGPAQLFHGNANGTFQNGAPHDDITLVGDVVVADVSGDGHADLVLAGLIQRGDGLGGFGPVEYYRLGQANLPAQVADLNGDLLPDIISTGDSADSVFIL